ncbi:MAG TPA: hypothetical protein VGF67_29085 [Ktedonobacteraceae bacterium]|jgi:hypothetical protein
MDTLYLSWKGRTGFSGLITSSNYDIEGPSGKHFQVSGALLTDSNASLGHDPRSQRIDPGSRSCAHHFQFIARYLAQIDMTIPGQAGSCKRAIFVAV